MGRLKLSPIQIPKSILVWLRIQVRLRTQVRVRIQIPMKKKNLKIFKSCVITLKKSTRSTVTTKVIVSALNIFMFLLQLCISKRLSISTLEIICKVINCFFKEPIIPNSRYLIDKLIYCKNVIEFHGYCEKCDIYIGEYQRKSSDPEYFENLQCCSCQNKYNPRDNKESTQSFFVIFHVERDITRLIIENEKYFNEVMNRSHENSLIIKDIYDGSQYKSYINSLPPDKKKSYCTGILNADGVPPFKNSKNNIWPLQIILNELPIQIRMQEPMLCGLWFGKGHANMEIFLKPLVQYQRKLSQEGVNVTLSNKKVNLKFDVICACADSPARADMQGISHHSGYHSCSWCYIEGKSIKSKSKKKGSSVKFPSAYLEKEPKPRTEHRMQRHLRKAAELQEPYKGAKYPTPLLLLPNFNVYKNFCPDYMHSVCMGITKQFAGYWFDSTKKPYSISSDQIKNFDKLMEEFKIPSQLARLSRPLETEHFTSPANGKTFYCITVSLF